MSVSSNNQTEKAYTQLRDAILGGTLQPGNPLLEVELAEWLKMSRTPVRAAIQRLKHEDFVESIPRKGIFVKPLTAESVQQIYEVMEGLEGTAAKLAAERATDAELDELRQVVETLRLAHAGGNAEEAAKADIHFHKTLRQLSHNKLIGEHLQQLDLHVARVRALQLRLRSGSFDRSVGEHVATVDAICLREGERARLLHQAHWQRIRQEIVSLLKEHTVPLPRVSPFFIS
jgi:DNA-binding GntR family transcriptional regulator